MKKRVRFAPSPTGYLHIGNGRAAVLNWLFALKYDAEFMLRLDDTDKERSTPEYADQILKDLEWLHIYPHLQERQSNRLERYNQAIELLRSKGLLYPCYETPEELDFKRKRQLTRGLPPIYDRSALALSLEEKRKLEEKGVAPHWRFRLFDEDVTWDDGIRGKVVFHGRSISDPVLIKSDSLPVYTLASVVDDIDFAMTDIIRGEDHVTNSAVQLQIYAALGGDLEQIRLSHFSLITDATGQGFSKREGSLSLKSLAEKGLDYMTIISLIARLGTCADIKATHDLQSLVNEFDLKNFSRSSPKFDPSDLTKLNQDLLHHLPYEAVLQRLPFEQKERLSPSFWEAVCGNLTVLKEVDDWLDRVEGKGTFAFDLLDKSVIRQALEVFPTEKVWTQETWFSWTKAMAEPLQIKGKALYLPLRLALTGLDHGPQMQKLLPLMGSLLVRRRLEEAMSK